MVNDYFGGCWFFFFLPQENLCVLLKQYQSWMSSSFPIGCQDDVCSAPVSWTERETLTQQKLPSQHKQADQ